MSTTTSTQAPAAPSITCTCPADEARLRVGEAERSRAVDLLAGHYAAGRLTDAEYDERSTRALTARTRGELAALFTDLPEGDDGSSAGLAPVAPRDAVRKRPSWTHTWLAFALCAMVLSVLCSHAMPVLGAVFWVVLCTRRHQRRVEERPRPRQRQLA